MKNNMETIGNPGEPTVLKVDGKQLETSAATAGLGYVKSSQTGSGFQTFTAEKTSEGTSWGAVYARSFQPLTDITDAQSGLKVKREVIVPDAQGTALNVSTSQLSTSKSATASVFALPSRLSATTTSYRSPTSVLPAWSPSANSAVTTGATIVHRATTSRTITSTAWQRVLTSSRPNITSTVREPIRRVPVPCSVLIRPNIPPVLQPAS